MKSITIHGLDDKLDELIKQKAKKQRLSLNKTIKNLLEKSFSVNANVESDRKKEFMDLFGVWTKNDEKQFNKHMSDFEKIDKEDWQ